MTGIELIAEERRRQIEEEGWTSEHDMHYTHGELASAAVCYTMTENERKHMVEITVTEEDGTVKQCPVIWPWEPRWWKPADRKKDLIRAGALIAAELDRLISEQ